MTVVELKRKLEQALNTLEDFEDNQKIKMVSNTYFLGNSCRTFLGLSGYNGGYINLDDPVENQEEYDGDSIGGF